MTKRASEIIGRSALFIMGAAFLFGGIKCISVAMRLRDEARQQQIVVRHRARSDTSGAGLPTVIGIVLILIGAPLALAAVVPVEVFARWFGPPTMKMGDNSTVLGDPDSASPSWWHFW